MCPAQYVRNYIAPPSYPDILCTLLSVVCLLNLANFGNILNFLEVYDKKNIIMWKFCVPSSVHAFVHKTVLCHIRICNHAYKNFIHIDRISSTTYRHTLQLDVQVISHQSNFYVNLTIFRHHLSHTTHKTIDIYCLPITKRRNNANRGGLADPQTV